MCVCVCVRCGDAADVCWKGRRGVCAPAESSSGSSGGGNGGGSSGDGPRVHTGIVTPPHTPCTTIADNKFRWHRAVLRHNTTTTLPLTRNYTITTTHPLTLSRARYPPRENSSVLCVRVYIYIYIRKFVYWYVCVCACVCVLYICVCVGVQTPQP